MSRSLVFLLLATSLIPLAAADKKALLPDLAGTDGAGHLFLWKDGTKIVVSDPWSHDILVGGELSGDKDPVWHLWGYSVEGFGSEERVRAFTLEVQLGLAAKEGESVPIKNRSLQREDFSVVRPDLLFRQGDALALVYGATTSHPRWELWSAGQKTQSKAWDDGRTYAAVAVGPEGELALAGRSGDGFPLVETADETVLGPVPGRLSAVLWNPDIGAPGWVAAGWGAAEGLPAQFLVWRGLPLAGQWLAPPGPPEPRSGGVFASRLALAAGVELAPGAFLAAGTWSERATGDRLPWVWQPDGAVYLAAPKNPTGLQTFVASGEAGWSLVLRSEGKAPQLLTEAGPVVLSGLEPTDTVTLVISPSPPAKQ
ncbi:MAG: hypothetical protein WCG80_11790 [Spirochaetales bacterium]